GAGSRPGSPGGLPGAQVHWSGPDGEFSAEAAPGVVDRAALMAEHLTNLLTADTTGEAPWAGQGNDFTTGLREYRAALDRWTQAGSPVDPPMWGSAIESGYHTVVAAGEAIREGISGNPKWVELAQHLTDAATDLRRATAQADLAMRDAGV